MTTLDYALNYSKKAGFAVFRLARKSKITLKGTKGCLDATKDERIIKQWFEEKDLNIGIVGGKKSGVFILDVDKKHNGDRTLAKFVAKYGDLPQTYTVKTPTGGFHYYFNYPDDCEIKNSNSQIGEGLDIRSDGYYVVAPPSVLPNGRYTIHERADIADAPEWLIAMTRKTEDDAADHIVDFQNQQNGKYFDPPQEIPEGQRNAVLTQFAGYFRRKGLNEIEIAAALSAINQQRVKPPKPGKELQTIAKSVCRYEPQDAWKFEREYPSKARRQREIRIMRPLEWMDYSVEKLNEYKESVLSFSNWIPKFARDGAIGEVGIGEILGIQSISGGGKTDFFLNLIKRNQKAGTIFVTADMIIPRIVLRMIQMEKELTKTQAMEYFNLKNDTFRAKDFASFFHVNMIDGNHSLRDLDQKIDEFESEYNIPVVVIAIDYIQKLRAKGDVYNRTRIIAQGLGELRDRTGCTIVEIMQPRTLKGAEKAGKSTGSGGIMLVENMDYSLSLHRDAGSDLVEVIVDKNRDGQEGITEYLIHQFPSRNMVVAENQEEKQPFDYKAAQANEVGF